MEIFQVDDQGQLFISPHIEDWTPILTQRITAVFDLDDTVDDGVPMLNNQLLYLYFPFEDKDLPDLLRLHSLAALGAHLITQGARVLVHCGMGHNRSALLAGLILTYLGMTGTDAVTRLRARRQGALYNKIYAAYLQALPRAPEALEWPGPGSPGPEKTYTPLVPSSLTGAGMPTAA